MTDTKTTEIVKPDEVIPPEGQTSGGLEKLVDGDGKALDLVRTDEWSDVSDGDLIPAGDGAVGIPRLTVNRKSDGGFVVEGTGEILRDIDLVWMARSQTRAWWPQAFGKGDKEPACRSNDGVEPADAAPAQQDGWEMPKGDPRNPVIGEKPAAKCVDCPNSRWNGNEPPACALAIEAMIGVPNFEQGAVELYRARFSGMGYAPAKNYWDTFSARLPKRPPIAFVTHVTLEEETTPNGVFLRPKFTRAKELTREQAQPLIEERDRRLGEWQEIVATAAPVDDDLDVTVPEPGARSAVPEDEEPF